MIKQVFRPDEFTGWHMLGVMFLFFGTIISVNLYLAWNAGQTWTGLVVKNTYVESQKFNERTATYHEQAKLGWQATSQIRDGAFIIQLTDRNGEMVRGAIVTAKIGRPVQENEDRTLQLAERAHGYETITELGAGLWEAKLAVVGPGGETWSRSIRFKVKG